MGEGIPNQLSVRVGSRVKTMASAKPVILMLCVVQENVLIAIVPMTLKVEPTVLVRFVTIVVRNVELIKVYVVQV